MFKIGDIVKGNALASSNVFATDLMTAGMITGINLDGSIEVMVLSHELDTLGDTADYVENYEDVERYQMEIVEQSVNYSNVSTYELLVAIGDI
jgi:hypothetical protein